MPYRSDAVLNLQTRTDLLALLQFLVFRRSAEKVSLVLAQMIYQSIKNILWTERKMTSVNHKDYNQPCTVVHVVKLARETIGNSWFAISL
jgi:hypothetical protein